MFGFNGNDSNGLGLLLYYLLVANLNKKESKKQR